VNASARTGSSSSWRAEGSRWSTSRRTRRATVALKIGDVAGGGRYVTRFLEITNQRRPEGISPDETPAEAMFFRQDGVRIDFLDVHEIDDLLREEAEILARVKSPNIVSLARVLQPRRAGPCSRSSTRAARRCARRCARSRASASTGS
jgi:hypothetical protein